MNHFLVPGHTVTGVEGVPFVVEQFFRENNLDYDKVHMRIIIVLFIQQTLYICIKMILCIKSPCLRNVFMFVYSGQPARDKRLEILHKR